MDSLQQSRQACALSSDVEITPAMVMAAASAFLDEATGPHQTEYVMDDIRQILPEALRRALAAD